MVQARPRKHRLKAGQKVGEFTIIQRLKDDKKAHPNLRIRYLVECSCGKRETLPHYYLTRSNPKQHCGCKRRTIRTDYNREYRIWLMMHERTENPNHMAYHHYGERGIKVCDEWHKSRGLEGFKAFLEFVGPAPSKHHSIDRVDNDLGYMPYHPETGERQVRWATAKEQRANQRPYKDGRT